MRIDNPDAAALPIPTVGRMRPAWRRGIAVVTALVFVVSSLFPLAAGFCHDTTVLPSWWGMADVIVAAFLATLTLVVFVVGRGRVTTTDEERSYGGYRVLIHAIFLLLVAMLFFGDRIVWSNCLPGFAWRYWLLLYSLPTWLAVLRAR
jgi:hypothetical protein